MKIFILGLGKVGIQLTQILNRSSFQLIGAYNRTEKSFNVPTALPLYFSLKEIPVDADVYLVSVSDDAVRKVANQLPKAVKKNKIVAHTSGIHTVEVFSDEINHPGIFYPLNTFTENNTLDWVSTPIYVSGRPGIVGKLKSIAQKIGCQVHSITADQKRMLHLSAVIVNNFPNALFQMAHQLLDEHQMDFDHLQPLIKTMVENLKSSSPKESQTGPAIRGDEKTVQLHLEMLSDRGKEKEREIYRLLTEYINPKIKA